MNGYISLFSTDTLPLSYLQYKNVNAGNINGGVKSLKEKDKFLVIISLKIGDKNDIFTSKSGIYFLCHFLVLALV